jgi:hypothetical protein
MPEGWLGIITDSERVHRPFVILFEQYGADEMDDDVLVEEDADHFGPPFDLTVETFDRAGAPF